MQVVHFETARRIDQTTQPKGIYLRNIRIAILEQ